MSINENTTVNSFNNEGTTVQGPTDDDNKIKSRKACMMEMPMNDGNISVTTMIGHELVKENQKKFLYARATNSRHVRQYHMQLIMECQEVVDEYRSMVEEERDLIPFESNLYKSDLAVISHIIYMIDVDIFGTKRPLEQS